MFFLQSDSKFMFCWCFKCLFFSPVCVSSTAAHHPALLSASQVTTGEHLSPVSRNNAATCRWNTRTAHLSAGYSHVSPRHPRTVDILVVMTRILRVWRADIGTRCTAGRQVSGVWVQIERGPLSVMKPNFKAAAGTMLGSPNSLSLRQNWTAPDPQTPGAAARGSSERSRDNMS